MCNRYTAPSRALIERDWHAALQRIADPNWPSTVFPRAAGPFIRRAKDDAGYSRELVVGRWGLIPWFAKTPDLQYATNNARSEEVPSKASYKAPWARSQRCIIPALDFDEPNWESGKNVWWRFQRADGRPLGLAGLWNTWVGQDGSTHESYTMLTINADAHPLMRRMHKPDKSLPADQQDKRSVIPLDPDDWDEWLTCTPARAASLLRMPGDEELIGAPV